MRFFEFSMIKPGKPLNPAQARTAQWEKRIADCTKQIERDKLALARERDDQRAQEEWRKRHRAMRRAG
jgi:hypothetical protein